MQNNTPLNSDIDQCFEDNSSAASSSKFFYSNDRFIETFDDRAIYDNIIQSYPQFDITSTDIQSKRKLIVQMLDDSEFIDSFKDAFGMNIHDFFKYIYRICPEVFNGLFVKKIQKTMQNKQYAKSVKYSTYRYRKIPTKKRRFKL